MKHPHLRGRRDSAGSDIELQPSPRNSSFTAARHRVPKQQNNGKGVVRSGSSSFQTVVFVVLGFFSLGVCVHVWQFSAEHAPPRLAAPFDEKEMVEFSTKYGTFTIDLFPEHAPKTVAAFQQLIKEGFYENGPGFYRNEPKFVLQGGGFLVGKQSPLGNLPVEYSLPSTERSVVIARGEDANSGNAEFAIMLHDNSRMNMPSESSPGFTVFGRVVAGWHTIEYISKKMPSGYLAKDDTNRQVDFKQVKLIHKLTNDNPEAKRRLEELQYVLETSHTAVLVSLPDCPEMAQIKEILLKYRASIRSHVVSPTHASHPYEVETFEAMTGEKSLPVVFINDIRLHGLEDVERLESQNGLQPLLDKHGLLAESTVWDSITKNPLVIFSKSYCPYCKKAKELFATLGATPVVFELDQREDGKAIQDFLFQHTGRSTVPNVFIRGKSIGGSDDTLKMHESGQLQDMLKRSGALK